MNTKSNSHNSEAAAVSRRQFLKHSSVAMAGVAAVSQFPFVVTSHAAPDDPIHVGVIGCGGRGTGAVLDVLGAQTKVIYPQAGYHTEDVAEGAVVQRKNVRVQALCDVFPDRLNACRQQLSKLGINVPNERCFTGFDGYKKLLAIPEINYVIHTTPPHFRPQHLLDTIKAGKHIFIEKPAAVDGPGVRMVLEAAELAKQKNLGIAAGTQRRHRPSYIESVKRLQDGAIGELHTARAYWNGGVIWVIEPRPGWSDMEWQLRNWNYFTWIGGDHIVEQHTHNLDIVNWVLGAHPVKAYGMGGRQARQHPIHGHIYDHFAVEFEYDNGARMFSQCRQMDGSEGRVGEGFTGTKGTAWLADGNNLVTPKGERPFRTRGSGDGNPYHQEHQNLIDSIRAGQPLNEGKALAETTLTAIMGREAAYSGQTIEWDQALNSKTRLGPEKYEFSSLPFPEVPMPGKHRFT
jgi:predicted dehydrogenase